MREAPARTRNTQPAAREITRSGAEVYRSEVGRSRGGTGGGVTGESKRRTVSVYKKETAGCIVDRMVDVCKSGSEREILLHVYGRLGSLYWIF